MPTESYKKNYLSMTQVGTQVFTALSSLGLMSKVLKPCVLSVLVANSEWNALNIPVHDRKHQLRTRELVGQCFSLVKELVQDLSDFYTYSELRNKVYPADADREPLSDANKKVGCSPRTLFLDSAL